MCLRRRTSRSADLSVFSSISGVAGGDAPRNITPNRRSPGLFRSRTSTSKSTSTSPSGGREIARSSRRVRTTVAMTRVRSSTNSSRFARLSATALLPEGEPRLLPRQVMVLPVRQHFLPEKPPVCVIQQVGGGNSRESPCHPSLDGEDVDLLVDLIDPEDVSRGRV